MRINWGDILHVVFLLGPVLVMSLLSGWAFHRGWRKVPSHHKATYFRSVGIILCSWVVPFFAMVGIGVVVSDVFGLVYVGRPLFIASGIAAFLLGVCLVTYLSGLHWLSATYRWMVSSLAPVMCLGMFFAFFIPSMASETNSLSWRYSSLNRMDRIADAIAMYAETHDGQWPPALTSLTEEGLLEPGQLTLPSIRFPKREGQWFYYPPSDDAGPTSLVASSYAYDSPFPGRCVLRANLSVEWLDSDAFRREIRQACNAGFHEALRQAKREAIEDQRLQDDQASP